MDYTPFGAEVPRSGQSCYGAAASGMPLFTGQIRDAEPAENTIGMDYFRARYY